jgi:hypothetical protein
MTMGFPIERGKGIDERRRLRCQRNGVAEPPVPLDLPKDLDYRCSV